MLCDCLKSLHHDALLQGQRIPFSMSAAANALKERKQNVTSVIADRTHMGKKKQYEKLRISLTALNLNNSCALPRPLHVYTGVTQCSM